MTARLRILSLPVAALTLIAAAACAPQDEVADSGSSPGGGSCATEDLNLIKDGTFTVGTDQPAYAPWFVDDDPSNGEGYESAVAYRVAEQLGFGAEEVEWVVVPFNSAVTPGAKTFDVDINQISITAERRNAVDFSTGYYDVAQTVITTKGSPIESATSVAELADAKLGAQVGTTSYTVINDQIKPAEEPAAFDTNDIAVQSLANGQVEGIVVDLPTAFYMTSAQLDNGVIVGQLPAQDEAGDQFGFVLDKGNSLTPCVSGAVDALREDGTLDALAEEWLAGSGGAPELQ